MRGTIGRAVSPGAWTGDNQVELGLREAKARFSEIVVAAQNGERVVITKRGEPAVEVVRYRRAGGIDFDKLDASCKRLGVKVDDEDGRLISISCLGRKGHFRLLR